MSLVSGFNENVELHTMPDILQLYVARWCAYISMVRWKICNVLRNLFFG